MQWARLAAVVVVVPELRVRSRPRHSPRLHFCWELAACCGRMGHTLRAHTNTTQVLVPAAWLIQDTA